MNSVQKEALDCFPILRNVVEVESKVARSVWESDLKTGKALEFTTLLAVVSSLSELGAEVQIDDYFQQHPGSYYLRNEVPLQHGAQAGHDITAHHEFSLESRFRAAVLPRASFSYGRRHFMLFREGSPVHVIETLCDGKKSYDERPDLVIVEGRILNVRVEGQVLSFSHVCGEGEAHIELSIRDKSDLPLKNYQPSSEYLVTTPGVIECSVSKTERQVNTQLSLYSELFATKGTVPKCLFVHGKPGGSAFTTLNINVKHLVSDLTNPRSREVLMSYLQKTISI